MRKKRISDCFGYHVLSDLRIDLFSLRTLCSEGYKFILKGSILRFAVLCMNDRKHKSISRESIMKLSSNEAQLVSGAINRDCFD